MAESKKAAIDVAELPVEEKLRTLYKLQKINSEIDKIRTLRENFLWKCRIWRMK